MTRQRLPKDDFFEKLDAQGLAVTYDDVRLRSGYSDVMPSKANIESMFSTSIPLKIPFVSADMDRVTEHKMAIEIEKLGGLGVLHKNMTPERQAQELAKVKNHLNGCVMKPVCAYENETIEQILNKKTENDYGFSTFPVISMEGICIGLLTQTDFDFCRDKRMTAKEIMTKIPDIIYAKPGTDLKQAYELMMNSKKKVLPLIDLEGEVAGMYVFSDVNRIVSGSHSSYNVDKQGRLFGAAALGVYDDAFARLELLIPEGLDVGVISTAHAASKGVIETIRMIKADSRYSKIDIVAGNISEPDSVRYLIDAGVNGIKAGQGPGSTCTTRLVAGIGCPQVTAVYEISKIADEENIPVCADGGIKYSGDVPVGIGAGARSVMIGNKFAGADESPGKTVFWQGKQWKEYRGMGSLPALEEHEGSRERYRQDDPDEKTAASQESGEKVRIAEGVPMLVPLTGPVRNQIAQFVGGLKQGMGYVGAKNIEELREKANFRMITGAGQKEAHPHDGMITEQPPNYNNP